MVSLSVLLHFSHRWGHLSGVPDCSWMNDRPPPRPWLFFAINFSCCIVTPDLFFLCGVFTYLCLPTNWTRTRTLVYSSPNIFIAPSDQPLPIPLIHKRMKRAIHFIPLLVGLGKAAGIGTGTAGLTTSVQSYHALSKDLSDSLQEIAQGLITIQNYLNSLVAIVLQNRRGLHLLTAEKGGLCPFLDKSCCFCAKQLGVVWEAAKNFADQASRIGQRFKQLLAIKVDILEPDALGFAPSWTIHIYYPPIHIWTLFV